MGEDQRVRIDYTNWRGERRERVIHPYANGFYFGKTEYHPTMQWLLRAWDEEKDVERVFAFKDIHAWFPLGENNSRMISGPS